MKVSYNQLTEMTGYSYRTLKRKLDGLKPVGKGQNGANLWESKEALPLIYAWTGAQGDAQGEGEKLDLGQERALLAQEQRIGQALKNAEAKKELVPASRVRETWTRIVVAAKTQFLALPDRLAQMLETAATFDARRALIDAEIKNILSSLAEGGE